MNAIKIDTRTLETQKKIDSGIKVVGLRFKCSHCGIYINDDALYCHLCKSKFVKVLKLCDLPNTVGFKFLAVLKDNTIRKCIVQKDNNTGLHSIKEVKITQLKGWIKL